MSETEVPIEVGQRWQHRVADREYLVEEYDATWDDVSVLVRTPGSNGRRRRIFGYHLRRNYTLAPAPAGDSGGGRG